MGYAVRGDSTGVRHGRKESVQSAWPAVAGYTSFGVEVAVTDQRPYVLSGSKQPAFVGLSRGGFGNPFDVMTESGQPLAQDVQTAVQRGLSNAGINASAASGDTRRAAGASSRLLLLILKEWKSDTYTTTGFAYDFSAEVYDAGGKLLGSQNVRGSRNTTSGVDGGRQALTELLGSKSISAALGVK